ncbi:MAG: hypothetical protein KAR21_07725 [Spirochaetales bacterium]|nr:hypothetical protein [Spirochaetales bacterium]
MRSAGDVTGVVRYLLDDAKLDISFKTIPEALPERIELVSGLVRKLGFSLVVVYLGLNAGDSLS